MKAIKYFSLFSFLLLLPISCNQSAEERLLEDARTVLIRLEHSASGDCSSQEDSVTFILSYGGIQQDVSVEKDKSAFINANVNDKASLNVKVQRTSDFVLIAEGNVSVRTESRPNELKDVPRVITFCKISDIIFLNF